MRADGDDPAAFVLATPAASSPAVEAVPDIRAPRRPRVFPALRHRDFQLFYIGYVISLTGTWMQRVAQSWLVLDLTNSAFWVGFTDAMGSVPVLLLTLYAGVVADRVRRRTMVVVTQTASMLFAFVLAALVLGGVAALWHVVALATLLGIANAFDIPARQALVVDLVGKRDLTNAIALNSSAFNATRVIGPAIAGVAIAALGVGICFFLNGVSFIAVIVALLVLRVPVGGGTRGRADTLWRELHRGVRHVATDARTRTLILNVAGISIFGLPAIVLMPVVARDVLGRGAEVYGWMMSAVGIGALAGALGLATFGDLVPRGRLLRWTAVAFGLAVVGFGLSRSLALSLVVLVAMGFAMIVTTALTNTLVQTLAPDDFRARAVAFYAWAFVGLSPLGALQAGTVAEWLGTGTAITLGGGICTLTAIGLLVPSRALAETR